MNGNLMFQWLVLGSREIDRMRKEIETAVACTLGLSGCDYEAPKDEVLLDFSTTPTCKWIFRRLFSRLYVECWLNSEMVYSYHPYHPDGGGYPLSLRAKNVQTVYDQMPQFIEQMIVAFPDLEKNSRPLLNAAKSALDRKV